MIVVVARLSLYLTSRLTRDWGRVSLANVTHEGVCRHDDMNVTSEVRKKYQPCCIYNHENLNVTSEVREKCQLCCLYRMKMVVIMIDVTLVTLVFIFIFCFVFVFVFVNISARAFCLFLRAPTFLRSSSMSATSRGTSRLSSSLSMKILIA
jgi:hypothetical protein